MLDGLGKQFQDVVDSLDDQGGLAWAEFGFEGTVPDKEVAVSAGVTGHAAGEVFELTGDLLALGLAVFATTGVAKGDGELVEVAKEFVRAAFGHAVLDAVFADAAGGFEQGPTAVAELNPVDGEMNVRAVAGGVIPDVVEIDRDFKAEEVDGTFKYGGFLSRSRGGFLEKHGEGFVENVRADVIFCPVHGAFAGGQEVVEVLEKAEPLLQRAVREGDFEVANGCPSFVRAKDADAKSTAGVTDELVEPAVKGLVVFSELTTPLESFVEDEVVEDVIDAFKLAPVVEVDGARLPGKNRDWTERQGVAF